MFRIRLKELREAAGYLQYAFAELFGVAQSTVGGWEAGKREPNYETTMRIAEFFDVSIDFLLGRTDTRNDGELIREKFDVIEGPPLNGGAPIVGAVRCGWNGTIDAEYTGEYEPVFGVNPNEHVWMRAKGDSMEPDIREGDLVLVHLQPMAENGDVVVAIINGEDGTLKRYSLHSEGIMLSPTNTKYSHSFIPADHANILRIYGKVVQIVRKM